MHIIFNQISPATYYIAKLARILFKKVYFLKLKNVRDENRVNFSRKLKTNDILPLPIENIEEINYEKYYEFDFDKDEHTYKRNLELVSEKNLKKFSSSLKIPKNNERVLRIMIQDVLFGMTHENNSTLKVWQDAHPKERVIFISFEFRDFYMLDKIPNLSKLIIPLNEVYQIFKKLYLVTKNITFYKKKDFPKNKTINTKSRVGYFVHQGLSYGSSKEVLFKKNLYYSEEISSELHKYNMTHFDYSGFASEDKNIKWVNLKNIQINHTKLIFLSLIFFLKNLFIVRGWRNLLGLILISGLYYSSAAYFERLKNFKDLKVAIIDYDILCPKTLILALMRKEILTFSTQERFLMSFYKSYGVISDFYFTSNDFATETMKKSKFYYVKNYETTGYYRSDNFINFEKHKIPAAIDKNRREGKRIVVALGFNAKTDWVSSQTNFLQSIKSQAQFLKDMISLSKKIKNIFVILRFKSVNDWKFDSSFKKLIDEIQNSENIMISENYSESFHSYKLCLNSDLIIAKHTSIADESLEYNKKVIFYDFSHNLNRIISGIFDYFSSYIFCHSFEDLCLKTQTILGEEKRYDYKNELERIKRKIGFKKKSLSVKHTIRNKILNYLERV